MALTFTPLLERDLPRLAAWLATPHVKRWWPDPDDLASVTARYLPMIEGADTTEGFVVEHDGTPIGFIQSYRVADEPDWLRALAVAVDGLDAVGIDYLIGEPGWLGRGLGTATISTFVEWLWARHPAASAVVVAVQQDNLPSWKALERAGFRRVWEGQLDSEEPSDQGPAYVYVRDREGA